MRRTTPTHRPLRRTPWRHLAAAVLAVLCLALAGLPGTAPHRAEAAAADLRRVIVEFGASPALAAGDASAAAASARRAEISRQQGEALAEAARRGIDVRQRRAYGLVLNGVAAEVPAADVERVAGLPGVVAVHPDRQVRALLDVSVPLVGAPELWAVEEPSGAGVTGEGQVVAIVDTGVDYTHPDLGGGFGPGHKVVAGYDYVNDDGDPMDDHGHGTHVAGIVAASGEVTGVAPGATLTAYKALNAQGGGFESDIVAAIEDAADPANPYRADVVNLSLGGPDTGDGPMDRAARAATESGVLVVAAAGNAGPLRATISSPASAEGVLAVGASLSGVLVPEIAIVEPEHRPLDTWRVSYSANPPEEPLEAEVVDVDWGYPWDFDEVDVEGKAVLVRGDVLTGSGPARLAEERGAVAVLLSARPNAPIAPGEPGTPGDPGQRGHAFPTAGAGPAFDGRFPEIVVVEMDASEYAAVERLRQGGDGPVVVRIGGVDATDEIAAFSSRGPTARHRLKPEVVAPGVAILSTVPSSFLPDGAYRFSGTSMAAPHVAGAAALLGQLHPGWTAGDIASALAGTSRPLAGPGPLVHGAGRLDVVEAAGATLLASPTALSLGIAGGTAEALAASAPLTLSNPTGEPVEVAFRHEPHGGGADVGVEPAVLTLPPGGQETVTVTLAAPRSGGDTDITGWVVAEAGGEDALRVPYAAFEATLHVHVSDPVFTEAEALLRSPTDLIAAPEVTVTGPGGFAATITATHDHGRWWRAGLPVGEPGAYGVSATADLMAPVHAGRAPDREGDAALPALAGEAAFEVLAPHQRLRGNAAWQPVGPDSDGGVLAPAGPGGMVVATHGPGRLWITGDRGRTWRQHGDLPVGEIEDAYVAVDPSDPRRMFAAVNGGYADETYRGRVLASADGGTTWATLPFPDVRVHGLHASADGDVLVAVTEQGAYVGRDGGRSWELVPADWTHVLNRDSALAGGDLYVGTFTGLWVVRDVGGAPSGAELLWKPPGLYQNVDAVAGDEDRVFATSLDGWTGKVHRSGDGGATWQTVLETDGPVQTLDLAEGRLVAAGFGFMHVSADGGDSWQARDEPVHGGSVLGAAAWQEPGRSGSAPGRAGRDPEILLGVQAAGVWSSRDPAGGWARLGVQGVTVHDLLLIPDDGHGEELLAGTRQGLYRTVAPTGAVTPAVRDWGRSGFEGGIGADVVRLASLPGDGALLRVVADATFTFRVERSDDGGDTWQATLSESATALDLLVHPAAPERVYVSYATLGVRGLFVSRDGGRTWHVQLHPVPFTTLAGDPLDPDVLWLGNALGLYRSGDGGITAELVAPGPVSAILTDPRAPDRLVVGGEELRVSEDGGETFQPAAHARLPMHVSTVVASPADPDLLLAGTSRAYEYQPEPRTWHFLPRPGRGVLVSRDGGQSWENLSDSLQNRSVTSLAVTADGKHLFAGTTGGGVHRLRLR